MLDAINNAVQWMNAEGVVKYFTEDAHITLTMPEAYGGQTLHLTREQYRERIDQAHAQIPRYRYERRDTKIAIDPGGQTALVTATLV